MTDLSDLVVGIVALNGRKVVGKTRLQKSFFLLEKSGMGSGVDFDYHNFGPFSADVALATDDAVAASRLSASEKPGFHAVPYTLYETGEDLPRSLGKLGAQEATRKLAVMESYSAIELELAATIVYLRDIGYGNAAVQETKLRKPVKATDDRVSRALQLIRELDLPPDLRAPEASKSRSRFGAR